MIGEVLHNCVFTDFSFRKSRSGFGLVIIEPNYRVHCGYCRYGKKINSNLGEAYAIITACQIAVSSFGMSGFTAYTDNKGIANVGSDMINSLCEQYSINVRWVKGHSNNGFNKLAHLLANDGRLSAKIVHYRDLVDGVDRNAVAWHSSDWYKGRV